MEEMFFTERGESQNENKKIIRLSFWWRVMAWMEVKEKRDKRLFLCFMREVLVHFYLISRGCEILPVYTKN